MGRQLHEKQKALLNLLKATFDNPLTVRELQEELDISSPSLVYHHIVQLEKKGYLKRNPGNPKDYQILSEPERMIIYLNLYGMAECGPNGHILDGDPIDRIPLASRIINFPSTEAFIVKAKGNSMEPRISEGDLVIAKKSPSAESGDTVVCVYKGMALIKKLFLQDGKIILHSENYEIYPPIIADQEDVNVEGVVKNIIKYE